MKAITITIGGKINNWTVLEEVERRYGNKRHIKVQCKCGEIRVHMASAIYGNVIKTCGCSKKIYPTVKVGDVFGRLTIIELTKVTIASKAKVRCICGKECYVKINHLNIGHTTSCGCFHNEQTANINKTHGLSNHKINALWRGIKKRCYNPKSAKFRYYGGHPTGQVIMCEEWLNDFPAFYDWCINNGWQEGLEIDKDKRWEEKHGTYPGKEYGPDYCCFMTKSENCRNRTTSNIIEYKGEKKSLIEWSEQLGIKPQLLSDRLFGLNMTPEEAFNKPVRNNSYKNNK